MRLFIACAFLIVACGGQVDGPSSNPSPKPFPMGPDERSYCQPGDDLFFDDFEDTMPGVIRPTRSGEGSLCEDTRGEAAFYPQYEARGVVFPDGKRGIRFPTKAESPGGYDYSMQSPYVTFRNRFLEEPCLSIAFTVRLPEQYDLDRPPYYGELRYLFRYYLEGKREIFSMRFESNMQIGFFDNDVARPEKIVLKSKIPGNAPLDVKIDACFRANGNFTASVGASSTSFQLSSEFQRGNVFFVTSPGNRLLSDDDLRYFSALDAVRVRRP